MIIGMSMDQETCRILGQVAHNLLYSMKKLLTDILGPGRDWRESSLHPGQIIYGQKFGKQWEETSSLWRSKSGLMKSSILKTIENCVGFYYIDPEDTEFKQTIENARKKLEISVALAMLCKNMKKNYGGGGFNKIETRLACILEADESTRLRLGQLLPNHHEDDVAGKGDNSLQHYNVVH